MPQAGRRLTAQARAVTLPGMDDDDRRLLDRLQNELPLTERPWASLAAEIGMPEDEMLERITKLRGEGVVRQISGIFDTRRLGYKSCLVAARSSEGKQQLAADVRHAIVEQLAVFNAQGTRCSPRRRTSGASWP